MSDILGWLERISQEDAVSSSASIDAPKDTSVDPACDESLKLKKGQGDEINDKNVSVDLTPKTDHLEVQGEKARSEESANPTEELDIKSKSETQGAKVSLESDDANKDLAGKITDVSKTEKAKVDGEGEVCTPKDDVEAVPTDKELDVTLKEKPSTEDASEDDEDKPKDDDGVATGDEGSVDTTGNQSTEPPADGEAAPDVSAADTGENETQIPETTNESENASTEGGEEQAAAPEAETPETPAQTPPEAETPAEPPVAEEGATPAADDTETPAETPAATEGAEEAEEAPATLEEPEPEVNPVEEAQEYLNNTAEDVDQLGKVQEALEGYLDILDHATAGGSMPVDPNLARAIYIGLEAFGDPWLTQGHASLEDFSDPAGQWVVSNEFVGSLKGKLSDTAKMLGNALQKLFDWLMDIWNGLTQDAEELKAKVAELSQRIAGLKGGNNDPMPLKGARRLYVNNFFVGNTAKPILDIARVGQAFLGNYPKMMSGVLNVAEQHVAHANSGEEALGGIIQAMTSTFRPEQLGVSKANQNEIPSSFQKFPAVAKSPTLPGNKAMYTGLKPVEGEDGAHAVALAAKLQDFFKVAFEDVPSKSTEVESQVKAPDQHTLATMAKSLDSLLSNIADFQAAKAELNGYKSKLMKSVGKMQQQIGLKDTQSNFLVGLYGRLMCNNMALPAGNYLGYVHSIAKVYIAVLTAFVNHHEGSEAGATVREAQTYEG